MANQEQLERLKSSVEGWNKWREENPKTSIDLTKADLREAHLKKANLLEANLREANLREAILVKTNLRKAHLCDADLSSADLSGADLRETYFNGTNFREVNLNLAVFNIAHLGGAVLRNIDLSQAEGLESVVHNAPSTLGTDTIQRSKGKIPVEFLRGCGLSDWEIESAKLYQVGLSTQEIDNILYRVHDLRASQAIQINPLFISYSHTDGAFVDEMEKHLNKKGIRFWRDIHDAMAGRLEKVVDRAIRQNPIVLLILSEHSVKSDWVEHEARKARELEKELGRDVLCPIALDEAWKDCKWPERLREQIMEYHILDFSKWKDKAEFGKMFRKLVDGLDLFYKEPGKG